MMYPGASLVEFFCESVAAVASSWFSSNSCAILGSYQLAPRTLLEISLTIQHHVSERN